MDDVLAEMNKSIKNQDARSQYGSLQLSSWLESHQMATKRKEGHLRDPKKLENPLKRRVDTFREGLSKNEREGFFDQNIVDPERRAQIWMDQADTGEECVDKYSWATPDERAMKVLRHFSPIIEIGCGANAYWCDCMRRNGIDVVGYDRSIDEGGTISQKRGTSSFRPRKGGPDVLSNKESLGRTLFLCYPDEMEPDAESESEQGVEVMSLGAACLDHYPGDYVIHVGELYGMTLSVDQAPWGRSSAPEFQQRLATEFHCVLEVSLSSWLHVRDTLTVWKRSQTCPIVFGAENEDDVDEEVHYRHIPVSEQLPHDRAAPAFDHLLSTNQEPRIDHNTPKPSSASKKKRSKKKRRKGEKLKVDPSPAENQRDTTYACPW